ncbi:MAG: 50S ribosomal protein L3 [Gemmatimonadales bacterium]|jgi:large subunit ribosomal protein L3
MNGLIGRKLGMTRFFDDDGQALPVTVIEAGPCPVVQVKMVEGAPAAVQLGFGMRKPKRTTKALAGHVAKANLEAAPSVLREFPLSEGDAPQLGDVVTVSIFQPGDRVKVTGTSRGKGFQGVVKRWGFGGGPKTHGNTRHRRPGSMGPGTDPSRVIKGKKLPGQTGNARVTELGLSIVRVDEEQNLVYVRGAVPGPKQGIVLLRKQESRGRYA